MSKKSFTEFEGLPIPELLETKLLSKVREIISEMEEQKVSLFTIDLVIRQILRNLFGNWMEGLYFKLLKEINKE